MNLPKRIQIGYRIYRVEVAHELGIDDDCGSHNCVRGLLRLNPHLDAQETANTLLHEILHGVVRTQGIALPTEEEERIVNTLSNGLAAVMVQNPGLMADIEALLREPLDSPP